MQKWFQKASVQAAIVAGSFILLAAMIQAIFDNSSSRSSRAEYVATLQYSAMAINRRIMGSLYEHTGIHVPEATEMADCDYGALIEHFGRFLLEFNELHADNILAIVREDRPASGRATAQIHALLERFEDRMPSKCPVQLSLEAEEYEEEEE